MKTAGRSHIRSPLPRPRKVGAQGLLIPSAVIAAGVVLGGCGGGTTTTTPSPGQNAPLGQHKDNPTQVPLGKDNPTQVPLSGEKDGKGAGS
jgi:hypothetical protein